MANTELDRRLTVRVFDIWKKLGGGAFPRRSQVDPKDFGTDWSNCLMIDLDPVLANSRLSHVGNALRDPTWPTFDRQSVSECLEGTLLKMLAMRVPQVVAKKKSVSFGGSAYHDSYDILYRAILLPLAEDGKRIDGILGAILYREVAEVDDLPAARMAAKETAQHTESRRAPRAKKNNA